MLVLGGPSIANGQDSAGNTKVVPFYYEQIAKKDAINDFRRGVRSCFDTPECNAFVQAVEAVVYQAPGAAEMTVETADSFGLGPPQQAGSMRFYRFGPIPGHNFCKVNAYIQSVGPFQHSRLDVAVKDDELRLFGHVDPPPAWGSNTENHIKAWITTFQVPSEAYASLKANGTCNVDQCWRVGITCGGGTCGPMEVGIDPRLSFLYPLADC